MRFLLVGEGYCLLVKCQHKREEVLDGVLVGGKLYVILLFCLNCWLVLVDDLNLLSIQ